MINQVKKGGESPLAQLRILFVEDSEADALILTHNIRQAGWEVVSERVDTQPALETALSQKSWDLILADYTLPRFSGLEALSLFKTKNLDIPFILVSGSVGEIRAVEAMKGGAHDFITKDNLSRLVPAIKRELNDVAVRASLRESEQKLIQAQKLESVGQMASGIAHDFNTLLGIIMLSCEMLLENTPSDDANYSLVDQVYKAAERGAGLTRQLLAFTRKQILESKVCDLNAITTGMKVILRPIVSSNIEMKMVLESKSGHIKVDPGQMEQVIMNLVVNARDAMPNGGSLTLQTQNIELREKEKLDIPDGRYIVLTVKDTGSGMSAETQAKIFDPFFTTKSAGKGTGLGLATVHGIVKQSGGHLVVSSALGSGTSMEIYLPQVDVPIDPSLVPNTVAVQAKASETILLLEDHEELCDVLALGLQKEGYTVLRCTSMDAVASVEKFQKPIHILLADVMTTRSTGAEIAKNLLPMIPDIKVLFMSGSFDQALEEDKLLKNRTSFLQKPFSNKQLLQKIKNILNQEREAQ